MVFVPCDTPWIFKEINSLKQIGLRNNGSNLELIGQVDRAFQDYESNRLP